MSKCIPHVMYVYGDVESGKGVNPGGMGVIYPPMF